ncbi:hypothetical protein CPB86DRAFT_28798 [Serendipita vermifera]|nr:hypothetical protein CPB86DRAFT_28798 [Serendipita vermifera]
MNSPYPNNATLLTTNASNAVLDNVETSTSILPPVHATDPSVGHSHRESRMTRSQHMLSGPEVVEDFKRSRTKFTPEQLHELEALFITHGPHPTREQRALVAEKIKV